MSDTRTRPSWRLPTVVAGGLLLAVILALTQPWLLFVDIVAQETLPTTSDERGVEEGDAAAADGRMAEDAQSANSAQPASPDEPEPTGPVELATGSFISRDHGTSGDVAIVRLEDGTRVLTIEGLATDNGPDLFVYLDDTPADGPEDGFDDGVSLGALRANIGDLVYEIPDDVDLDGVASVGIWCDRFSSLFGAADLVRG